MARPLTYWYIKKWDHLKYFKDSWSGVFVLHVPNASWATYYHYLHLPVPSTRIFQFTYNPNWLFD